MKKLLALAVVAGAAAWAYKAYQESRAYDALWADATDFPDEPVTDLDLR